MERQLGALVEGQRAILNALGHDLQEESAWATRDIARSRANGTRWREQDAVEWSRPSSPVRRSPRLSPARAGGAVHNARPRSPSPRRSPLERGRRRSRSDRRAPIRGPSRSSRPSLRARVPPKLDRSPSKSPTNFHLKVNMPHNETGACELAAAEVVERPSITSGELLWQAQLPIQQGGTNHAGNQRMFTIRGPPRKSQELAEEDARRLTTEATKGPKAVRTLANQMHRPT